MPYLELAYWLRALLLAGLAVCWADVLVRPGMLLAPVQAALKAWYRKPYRPVAYTTDPEQPQLGPIRCWGPEQSKELDYQWWWPPLWGCYKCVAGQWGFWAYLWLYRSLSYSPLAHLGFTATTIILSLILSKWSQEQ